VAVGTIGGFESISSTLPDLKQQVCSMQDTTPSPTPSQGDVQLSPASEGVKAARQAAVLAERPSGVPSSQQIFRDRVAEVYGPPHNRSWTPEMLAASEINSTTSSAGTNPPSLGLKP